MTFDGLRIVYEKLLTDDAITNSSDLVFVFSYSLTGLVLLASVISLFIWILLFGGGP